MLSSVMPNVIEKSVRTVVVHGLAVRMVLLNIFLFFKISNRISSWWLKGRALPFSEYVPTSLGFSLI
jgi:hypothetical protein